MGNKSAGYLCKARICTVLWEPLSGSFFKFKKLASGSRFYYNIGKVYVFCRRNEMERILKRAAAAVIACAVLLTPAVAYAEPSAQTALPAEESQQQEAPAPINPDAEAGIEGLSYEEALQKSYDTQPETNSIAGWPKGPQVYGCAAIVMDMDSGAVLYGKKVDDKHYPASITKLMTALVALENADMDDEVEFSPASIDILRWDYASIGMKPGEILSLKDAMYGMLLASGNEVAYAIAESVGNKMGIGYDGFIQKMNDRAVELGCTGSNWVNANGLHDDLHYTTAHDMALIASELYKHEEFRTVTQTLNYTIGATNLTDETRAVQQNHKMLWPNHSRYYEYCTGGKTGYTDNSRTTLVTMAENGTLRLAAVVLRDNGNVYDDTRAMFDYVFENFSKVMLKEQTKPEEVRSYTEDGAYVLLPEGIDFSSLEHQISITDEREASGTITFYYEGQNVGSADVTLTPEYIEETTGYTNRMDPSGETEHAQGGQEESGFRLPGWLTAVLIVAAVVLILFALVIIRLQIIRAKRRKRAQMKRRRMRQRQQVQRRPQEQRLRTQRNRKR